MARSTQYFGIQITLTQATATKLLTALQAVDPNIPPTVRELTIQCDSVATIQVGDAAISTTRYGYFLTTGASKTYRSSSVQDVPLGAIFLLSTGAAKVNIEGWS